MTRSRDMFLLNFQVLQSVSKTLYNWYLAPIIAWKVQFIIVFTYLIMAKISIMIVYKNRWKINISVMR